MFGRLHLADSHCPTAHPPVFPLPGCWRSSTQRTQDGGGPRPTSAEGRAWPGNVLRKAGASQMTLSQACATVHPANHRARFQRAAADSGRFRAMAPVQNVHSAKPNRCSPVDAVRPRGSPLSPSCWPVPSSAKARGRQEEGRAIGSSQGQVPVMKRPSASTSSLVKFSIQTVQPQPPPPWLPLAPYPCLPRVGVDVAVYRAKRFAHPAILLARTNNPLCRRPDASAQPHFTLPPEHFAPEVPSQAQQRRPARAKPPCVTPVPPTRRRPTTPSPRPGSHPAESAWFTTAS